MSRYKSHFSHSYLLERNAALRAVRKTKGFLILPVSIDDPSYSRRRAIAREYLGRNARVVSVQPTEHREFWRNLRKSGRQFYVRDEGTWVLSSDPALVADADLLAERLPRLMEALDQIDRLRKGTGLNLPAWIFLFPGTIITEEAARRDAARAPSVLAKAQEVRARDSANLASFYETFRSGRSEPVVIEQSLRDFQQTSP